MPSLIPGRSLMAGGEPPLQRCRADVPRRRLLVVWTAVSRLFIALLLGGVVACASSSGGDGMTVGGGNTGGGGTGGGGTGGGGTGGGGTGGGGTGGGGTGGGGTGGGGTGGGGNPTGPVVVVVLGSSTAAGKNLDEPANGGVPSDIQFSWVNRYRTFLETDRPGSRVVNLSVPGHVTYHAMPTGTFNPPGTPAPDPANNITAALAENPDAIIVNYPNGAGYAPGTTTDASMDAFNTLINLAANDGVEVWITTPNPRAAAATTFERTSWYLDLRSRVLNDFGTFGLDFWAPRANSMDQAIPALTLSDDIHPNIEGHRLLFDVVVAADIPGTVLP